MDDLVLSDRMDLETPSPPASPPKRGIGCSPPSAPSREQEVGNVTGTVALSDRPQNFFAVVIPAKSVEDFELENRDHIVQAQTQFSSPIIHQPQRTPKKKRNRNNTSQRHNMDPSYRGRGAVSKETGPLPEQVNTETEDPIMSDEEDESEGIEEDGPAGTQLGYLPRGLKLEDIQDPQEREKIRSWLEMGNTVATLAGSLQKDQTWQFINSGHIEKSFLANFIDWNKVVFERTGTKVNMSREDMIREGFTRQFPEYPIDENNPDEAVDAYTVMTNIYDTVANDIATIQDFSAAPQETQYKMLWYRALYHDIRGKEVIAGTKEVEEMWKSEIPHRYRSVATIREAFHYLCNIQPPTFPWPSSHDFFLATLDMIRVKKAYCMLVFDVDTDRFLGNLKKAMADAENRAITEWIAARSNEQFYDLMGTGLAPNFKDKIQAAPNPYSSVVE